ncbi:TrmH family RNA methyltransferase [Paenibacillus cymbidii]|uniref:TrmH family RNA methyltransferase n=1 Tax=Paenibacillus cymbidii TaxID=1639034 RepID=UPI00108144F5|nr:RNA methyltransferase [Paenibacillus cymbidii]
MEPMLTSVANPRVKQWSELLTKRGRDKTGKFLLEGVHLIEEAKQAGHPLETLLFDAEKGLPESLAGAAAQVVPVSAAVLAKCSDTQTPQGVIAIAAKLPPLSGEQLAGAGGRQLVVVVDGVQDPGNLGTIIRSADAVAASAVLLGPGTVDLYNPKTIRATMGSLFHLHIGQGELLPWLAHAAAAGAQVVGTSLAARQSCYELDLTQSTWLVFGSEGAGVSPQVEAHVTQRAIIPMPGRAESLNVAMAATVLLFEAARQRGLSKPY